MKKDNLSDQFQVNDEIRAKEVRIIGEGFEPKVVSLREALQIADSMELDLVLISPNAVPPVCRIVDFSKFIYQLKKKQKEAENGEVNVRKQGAENLGNMKIDDFGKKIADEVNSMINKW